MNMATSRLIATSLAENRRFDPNFRDGHLANHHSMALLALEALGASEARVLAFVGRKPETRDPLRTDGLARDRWAQEILVHGLDVVVTEHVMRNLAHLGGDAFHPLIRLAHALDWATSGRAPTADAAAEVAHALAYLTRNADDFAPDFATPGSSRASTSARAVLDALSASGVTRFEVPGRWGGLVSEQMRVLGYDGALASVAGDLVVHAGTLAELRVIARELYARVDDFTSLHLMTGCRAARVVQRHLPAACHGPFMQAFWSHFLLAYRAMLPLPEVAESISRADEIPTWPTIALHAVESRDDHALKLVHAARDEDAIDPDPLYAAVAWRAASRGSSVKDSGR